MLDICLYTDISEDEKEAIVALESCEVKLDRLLNTYSAIMEAAELNIREAELKCFEESGDMDDLEEYYREAEEKTAEQSKGIFQKIKEGIVSFFRKISEFLFGKKNKVSDEGEAEAPAGLLGFAQKIINAFKSGFGKLKNALINHKVGAGVVAAGGVAVAAFAFINRDAIKNITESGKKERISKKAGKEAGEGLAQAAKDIADACDQVDDNKPDEETKKLFGRLRTIGSCIQSAGSTLLDFCVGAKSAIKDKFSKDGEDNAEEGGSKEPSNNGKKPKVYKDYTGMSDNDPNAQKKKDTRTKGQRENDKAAGEEGQKKGDRDKFTKDYYRKNEDGNKTNVAGLISKLKSNNYQKAQLNELTPEVLQGAAKTVLEQNLPGKQNKRNRINAIKNINTVMKSNSSDIVKIKKIAKELHLTLESEENDILDDDLFSESFDDDFDSLLDGMFGESEEEDDEDNFVEESEDDFWNNNADSFFEEAAEIDDLLNDLFIGESSNEEDD